MGWNDLIIIVAVSIAVYTDVRTGLIKNWLTAPLLFTGCVLAYLSGGWAEVLSGVVAGFSIACLTFMFSTPGGGDIKLAMAVGPWIGMEHMSLYLLGAWGVRVALSLIIRLKTCNWKLVPAFNNAVMEMKTWQLSPLGEKNFKVFQRAAVKCGGSPDLPAVPGALWVAGGVAAEIILKGVL